MLANENLEKQLKQLSHALLLIIMKYLFSRMQPYETRNGAAEEDHIYFCHNIGVNISDNEARYYSDKREMHLLCSARKVASFSLFRWMWLYIEYLYCQ